MAGVPATGLRAGDTEKKETSLLPSRTQSSVVPADKATVGGMRAQTRGLMEELLRLKNQKQKQKPTAGEPANLLVTGTLCFSIFIGLVRMEASVARIVVVNDILTGLILLSCPTSMPPVTLSKVGTVTYIKKWKLALLEPAASFKTISLLWNCALLA